MCSLRNLRIFLACRRSCERGYIPSVSTTQSERNTTITDILAAVVETITTVFGGVVELFNTVFTTSSDFFNNNK